MYLLAVSWAVLGVGLPLIALGALAVWRRPLVAVYAFAIGLAFHNAVFLGLWLAGAPGWQLTLLPRAASLPGVPRACRPAGERRAEHSVGRLPATRLDLPEPARHGVSARGGAARRGGLARPLPADRCDRVGGDACRARARAQPRRCDRAGRGARPAGDRRAPLAAGGRRRRRGRSYARRRRGLHPPRAAHALLP